jgi:hypothetical protein
VRPAPAPRRATDGYTVAQVMKDESGRPFIIVREYVYLVATEAIHGREGSELIEDVVKARRSDSTAMKL